MRAEHAEASAADPDTLHAVTTVAAEIFTASPRAHAAKAYLHRRGIDLNVVGEEWVVGYAPPGWTRLVDVLRPRFGDQALLDAGIARRTSRGNLIDSFRARVVFGVRNGVDGQLVGFIGRDLSGDPNAPKYLNTHRNALYDKSALLFGMVEGKDATIAQQPVIVEGPLDVLAIAGRLPHGSRHLLPVASCGTAFTAAHARQIAASARADDMPVVVAMDGDQAGRSGALAAAEQLRRTGLDVRIANLPDGTDPADYLARPGASVDAFRADHATSLLTVRVHDAIAQQGDRMQWVEGRLAAMRNITRFLTTYPAGYAAQQIGWLADQLELEPSTIAFALADAFRNPPGSALGRARDRYTNAEAPRSEAVLMERLGHG